MSTFILGQSALGSVDAFGGSGSSPTLSGDGSLSAGGSPSPLGTPALSGGGSLSGSGSPSPLGTPALGGEGILVVPISMQNTFEGGVNGATIVAATSGGASGKNFSSVSLQPTSTATYDSSTAAHGSLSLKAQATDSAGYDQLVSVYPGLSPSWALRGYVRFGALPTAGHFWCFASLVKTSVGTRGYLGVDSSGHVIVANALTGIVGTSTTTIPLNTWVRVEAEFTVSATIGQATVRIYATSMDSNVADETFSTAATQNFGGLADETMWALVRTAVTPQAQGPIWVDEVASNNAGIPIGPYLTTVASTPALSGSGALSAAGTVTAAPALSGSGSLGAIAAPAVPVAPSLGGSGNLTVAGTPSASVTPALSGTGALVVGGTPATSMAASLAGSGSLATTAIPAVPVAPALAGGGSLQTTVFPAAVALVPLSGDGTLSLTDTLATAVLAALSGDGTLMSSGAPAALQVVTLSGDGTLDLSASAALVVALTLSGDGELAAVAAPHPVAIIGLDGDGALSATGTVLGFGLLTGSGVLVALADFRAGAVHLSQWLTETAVILMPTTEVGSSWIRYVRAGEVTVDERVITPGRAGAPRVVVSLEVDADAPFVTTWSAGRVTT